MGILRLDLWGKRPRNGRETFWDEYLCSLLLRDTKSNKKSVQKIDIRWEMTNTWPNEILLQYNWKWSFQCQMEFTLNSSERMIQHLTRFSLPLLKKYSIIRVSLCKLSNRPFKLANFFPFVAAPRRRGPDIYMILKVVSLHILYKSPFYQTALLFQQLVKSQELDRFGTTNFIGEQRSTGLLHRITSIRNQTKRVCC